MEIFKMMIYISIFLFCAAMPNFQVVSLLTTSVAMYRELAKRLVPSRHPRSDLSSEASLASINASKIQIN